MNTKEEEEEIMPIRVKKSFKPRNIIRDKKALLILNSWFAKNLSHPYATIEQKTSLAKQAKISYRQVSNWLIGKRRNAKYKKLRVDLSNS